MKRERAYVEGRRHQVLEMLQRNPQVRVDELAKRLGVSVVTLRRDLQFLEEKKQIRRFYGGASVSKDADGYMDDVAVYRDLIARYAATLVEDGDMISIDIPSGSLVLEVDPDTLEERRKRWTRPSKKASSVMLEGYRQSVGPADQGAVWLYQERRDVNE